MSWVFVSNASSWVLATLILFLVHHIRVSNEPFATPIAVLYAFLALSLLTNTVVRVLDESYYYVLIGSVFSKVFLSLIIMLTLLKEYKLQRKRSNG